MSKTCTNCGNIFEDDSNICPRCGTQYIAVQPPQPERTEQYAENGYNQAQPQYQYQQQYQQYQQPFQQPYGQAYQQPQYPAEQPMGVGSWVGTILLTSLFGIISLILLFVWAFGSDVPIAKRNYCRAMLIVELIGVALSIIFLIIFIAIFSASGAWDQFIDALENIDIKYGF